MQRRLAPLLLALGCSQQPAPPAAPGPASGAAAPPEPAPAPAAPRAAAASAVPELQLRAVLPVVADASFQPSGLVVQDGLLLTVSDKHDGAIYALELGTESASVRPFIAFAAPDAEPGPLDFEGLCADAGGFWIASESRERVLRVEPEPGAGAAPRRARASWASEPLEATGRAAGVFLEPNAGLEGIAPRPDGGLLLAVERDPRGLIELGPGAPRVWPMPTSPYPPVPPRGPDFTDLARVGDALYALARNAHQVVRLERGAEGWAETRAFGFGATENDPRYWYETRTYGRAEGLAIDARSVYVVLDNNEQRRVVDPADRRPLLFVFDRPGTL